LNVLNSYFLRDEGHNQYVGPRALQAAAKSNWLYFRAIRSSSLPLGRRGREHTCEYLKSGAKEGRKRFHIR